MKTVETNKERNYSSRIFKSGWERLWRNLRARCPNCGSRKLKDITVQNLVRACFDCGHKIFETIQKGG